MTYNWEDIWSFCGSIEGFYAEDQARFIYDHAVAVQQKPGVQVEVGTFRGRSAAILAFVGPLYCIDPMPYQDVCDHFLRIISRHPCGHNIKFLRNWDHEVVGNWTEQVRLFHLDTDMRYDVTHGVVSRWMPKLTGAKLLLHHYEENVEVRRAINDLPITIAETANLVGVGYVGKLFL
jgi:hypothetical protein